MDKIGPDSICFEAGAPKSSKYLFLFCAFPIRSTETNVSFWFWWEPIKNINQKKSDQPTEPCEAQSDIPTIHHPLDHICVFCLFNVFRDSSERRRFMHHSTSSIQKEGEICGTCFYLFQRSTAMSNFNVSLTVFVVFVV